MFIIVLCDRAIGAILKVFYFRQELGGHHRTTYIIDSTLAEVLIFGSSRANHHYVPEIFEDKLHCTCFNTGVDGQSLLYNYAILKTITNRYNPRLIIIDISPEDLNYSAHEYERLSALLPYYQAYPEISRVVDLRGPFEKLKSVSACYPYNSLFFEIANANLHYKKKKSMPEINGYIPIFKIMKDNEVEISTNNTCNIDENKINAMEDIILTCKQKGIDLIFVYSPIWLNPQESYCNNVISELCFKNGIDYIDLSHPPCFYQ